ncbi:hypothetical protein EV200_101748 [Pedobacter psychrotolerans]|uniref:Uncharacterized protein n=1 Tax=Pedobacter psychrotolerans TaxID=1843235 RepID=A0A4R2HM62_9SPHI|nr:hypothetical protein [Pedobacter psychrotolerans]TCO31299.1 hypothetical protein EV200_101748 [Pedobacter psychrotolerans]GGE40739.1 hypothetical protein GCM10011413_03220 [Pedobacter psychrotolerans]
MNFETLVKHVLQLSDIEKRKLRSILNDNELSIINEEAALYINASAKNVEFDKKWEESLDSKQFKDKAIQHINSLPWK